MALRATFLARQLRFIGTGNILEQVSYPGSGYPSRIRAMSSEWGSGSGRGGGTGGSVRDAGGAFGKMEAAHEEQYFRKLREQQLKELKTHLEEEVDYHEKEIQEHKQADQLAELKEHLDEEIIHHEHSIQKHQEAIERHKKRISSLHETEKKKGSDSD